MGSKLSAPIQRKDVESVLDSSIKPFVPCTTVVKKPTLLLRPEEFRILKERTIMKIKPLNTVTLNSLSSCLVSKS